MIQLRVWANARPMGWFGHEAGEFFFAYDSQWLAQPGAYVLAPPFALTAERFTGVLVRNFFENLLPEGQVLEDVLAAIHLRHASDTRQARDAPSAINEYACMQLARALKLPVPKVWLLRVPEAAHVVQRYDRHVPASGDIVSLHQIDGCQLLGHGAGWKYERAGGLVSLPKLVQALRALGVRGKDMLALQRWVMFNYLIGNADAHAKNISVLIDGGRPGYKLAPFYDLVCVRAYGDSGLALHIGDEDHFDAVGRHSWEAFCQDCGFAVKETLKELRAMALALLPAWAVLRAHIDQQNEPTDAEGRMLDTMTRVFAQHQRHVMSMLGED